MRDNFLYLTDQIMTFKEFKDKIAAVKDIFKSHSLILLKTRNLLTLYSAILAAKELNLSLYVCPFSFSDIQVRELAAQFGGVVYLDEKIEGSSEKKDIAPGLGIFTSGTTGEPKIALHRWEAIEASSRFVPQELYHQTWLLSYSPWGYAGLQVFFSVWNSGGSIYYEAGKFQDICMGIIKHGVSVISATPTFWKMLIGAWPKGLKTPHLLQATIGGEIVDQPVIDLVDTFFHPHHLTHIYASTEVGSAIIVSDRMAGFPLSYLDKETRSGVKLRITDHELEVLSPIGMEKYIEGTEAERGAWISTGDLVEIRAGRVYFLGRTDGRINIGGRKVCPEEVEQALNLLDEVEDCLVYEKKSPIVGSLIAADLIIKDKDLAQFNPMKIKQKLKNHIEDYKIPHIIRRVDHFAISSTGKKIRTST